MPDFEEIYQTYFADVYRYILALSRDAHTAEEVTQETFFRALASIDQFRGDCQLRVWLCQIARNQYLSLCRERKHRGAGAGAGGRRAGVRLCGPGRRQAAPPAAP
ncbi:sigma factor [Dysosmobacter sp.]|uniref:RNA polymerase sigma factor n=1 Tax=Dysosmobacter sp. TaxID=2591382 RepID=UPI0028529EDC|nr:sigma factor [Dysosmobacter sp.]